MNLLEKKKEIFNTNLKWTRRRKFESSFRLLKTNWQAESFDTVSVLDFLRAKAILFCIIIFFIPDEKVFSHCKEVNQLGNLSSVYFPLLMV